MNNTSEILPPKLYQLTLFYNSLQDNKLIVQQFQNIIKDYSDNKYRVLSFGSQVCAIGFVAIVEPERLRTSFSKVPSNGESFNYLLVEVNGIIAGSLSEDTWKWLDKSPVDYKFWNK